jgi:hypothetical protein
VNGEGQGPGGEAPGGGDGLPPEAPSVPVTPVHVISTQAPAVPAGDRWAHRRGEPRTFAAAWILFLFGATVVSVGAVGAFGLLSADVYRPAARVMVEITAVGLAVLWPMVRLSQEAPRSPLRAMAQDLIVMLGPVQAVVWPQALFWMAAWPVSVVLCLDLFLCGWGLLVGGLLAGYFVRPVVRRWAMMALLLLLMLVGPVVAALMRPDAAAAADPALSRPAVEWLMTSPLTGVYEITRDRSWTGLHARVDARHWAGVVLVWACAAASWAIAGWLARGRVGVARGPGMA